MNLANNLDIRLAQKGDERPISQLYNTFIESSVTTFETKVITALDMRERIQKISTHYPYLIAEENQHFAGFAYATQWKSRQAYFATVESTIYLNPSFAGRGIGFALYSELLRMLQARDVHAVIGGIALPNKSSIALHLKCGFTHIGTLKEVGFKLNKWIDVAYYEKILNGYTYGYT